MTEPDNRADTEADDIVRKAQRKQAARNKRRESPMYGLGMFGLVGWAIAVPTVLGVALGLWIDARFDTTRSWTLVCLLGGVTLGCLNAWYWVQKEGRDD